MPYPKVVALIDAEIDRLVTVRNLLLPIAVSPKAKGRKQTVPVPSEAQPALLAVSEPITHAPAPPVERAAAQPEAHPAIEKIVKKERKARAPMSRRKTTPLATALRGSVPAMPVFVSANEVRTAQTQKVKAEAVGPNQFASSQHEALTPELLSQRWLRGIAN